MGLSGFVWVGFKFWGLRGLVNDVQICSGTQFGVRAILQEETWRFFFFFFGGGGVLSNSSPTW